MRRRWTASGTRCSVSAIARTTISAATPSRWTAGWRSWVPPKCSTAPTARPTTTSRCRWAEDVVDALGVARRLGGTPPSPSRSPGPSRSRAAVPQHRLTAPRRKRGAPVRFRHLRVRRHLRGRGLSGRLRHQQPRVVDAWLTATGLVGAETVEVDGASASLREALTPSYDICRVTPNLLRFVAEQCAGGRPPKSCALRGQAEEWLAGRNGSDIVRSSRCVPSRSSGRRCWCG